MPNEEYKKKFIESDEDTPRIFLVCTETGEILEAMPETNFGKVYKNTIGMNNGELLIELTREDYEEIVRIAKQLGWGK